MTESEIRALVIDYGGVLMRTVDPRPRRELEQQFGRPDPKAVEKDMGECIREAIRGRQ